MIDIYVEKGKYFIYSKFHDRSFFPKIILKNTIYEDF